MTLVTLSLGGLLWRVKVPAEIEDTREQMIWAQGFAAAGGLSMAGWQAVIRQSCPGVGWVAGGAIAAPLPFGVAVSGRAVSVGSDRSLPAAPARSPIQTPPPPPPLRHGSGAASGSAAPHRPAPQRATSSASRPGGHALMVERLAHGSRPAAKQHTVGWMGSAATSGGGK
jgi:hypothetical protein